MSQDEIPEVLLVDSEGFAALMDEVLRAFRGRPRSYLQPALVSSRMDYPEYEHVPRTNPKSMELAMKRRPQHIPVHEAMLHEWEQTLHKLEVRKAASEQAELAECTFEPKFVSEQLVSHGRALRDSQTLSRRGLSSVETSRSTIPDGGYRRAVLPKGSRSSAPATPKSREPVTKTAGAATLLELAGMGQDSGLAQLEEDELLKNLGMPAADDFSGMERELQQILDGSTTDASSASFLAPTAAPETSSGAAPSSRPVAAPKWNLQAALATDSEDDGSPRIRELISPWAPQADSSMEAAMLQGAAREAVEASLAGSAAIAAGRHS